MVERLVLSREYGKVLSGIVSSFKKDPSLRPKDHLLSVHLICESIPNDGRLILFDVEKYHLRTPRTDNGIDFSQEMQNVVDSLLAKDGIKVVKQIIDDLEKTLNISGYKGDLQCYGSYENGLACIDSDIDLYMNTKSPVKVIETGEKFKPKLKKSSLFKEVIFIKYARIPILKFIHVNSGKECSISFTNEMGIYTSALTKYYCYLNPNAKYLSLYLKYLLKKYKLQGTGKITTHMIFWLVVFLMQQKKLLPSVCDVRKLAIKKHSVDGWDCSIPEGGVFRSSEKPQISLYGLLLDFLKFYNDFDFLKYVICPYLGCAIPLSDLENLKIPEAEFSVYLKKVRESKAYSFPGHVMNVQDTTNHSYNLTKQLNLGIVNGFKLFCNTICKQLSGNFVATIPLEKYLPLSIPKKNNLSVNLVQFVPITWKDNKKAAAVVFQDISAFIKDVCKVMEIVFNFEKKCTTCHDIPRMIIYCLEYRATFNTWKNAHISRILSFPQEQKLCEPFDVFIRCEVSENPKTIVMMVQGEARFTKFFTVHLKNILHYMRVKNCAYNNYR